MLSLLPLYLYHHQLLIPDCNVAQSILPVLPQEDAVHQWREVVHLLLHLLTSLLSSPTDPTPMLLSLVPLLVLDSEVEAAVAEEDLVWFRCDLSRNHHRMCWATTLAV